MLPHSFTARHAGELGRMVSLAVLLDQTRTPLAVAGTIFATIVGLAWLLSFPRRRQSSDDLDLRSAPGYREGRTTGDADHDQT